MAKPNLRLGKNSFSGPRVNLNWAVPCNQEICSYLQTGVAALLGFRQHGLRFLAGAFNTFQFSIKIVQRKLRKALWSAEWRKWSEAPTRIKCSHGLAKTASGAALVMQAFYLEVSILVDHHLPDSAMSFGAWPHSERQGNSCNLCPATVTLAASI